MKLLVIAVVLLPFAYTLEDSKHKRADISLSEHGKNNGYVYPKPSIPFEIPDKSTAPVVIYSRGSEVNLDDDKIQQPSFVSTTRRPFEPFKISQSTAADGGYVYPKPLKPFNPEPLPSKPFIPEALPIKPLAVETLQPKPVIPQTIPPKPFIPELLPSRSSVPEIVVSESPIQKPYYPEPFIPKPLPPKPVIPESVPSKPLIPGKPLLPTQVIPEQLQPKPIPRELQPQASTTRPFSTIFPFPKTPQISNLQPNQNADGYFYPKPNKPFNVEPQRPYKSDLSTPTITQSSPKPFIDRFKPVSQPEPFIPKPQRPAITPILPNLLIPERLEPVILSKPVVPKPAQPEEPIFPQNPFISIVSTPKPQTLVVPTFTSKPFVTVGANSLIPGFETKGSFTSVFPQPQNEIRVNVSPSILKPTSKPFQNLDIGYVYPKPGFISETPKPFITEQFQPKPSFVPENPKSSFPNPLKPIKPESSISIFPRESSKPTSPLTPNRFNVEQPKPVENFQYKPLTFEPLNPLPRPRPDLPSPILPALQVKPNVPEVVTSSPLPSVLPYDIITISVPKPTFRPLLKPHPSSPTGTGYIYPKPSKSFEIQPQTSFVLRPKEPYSPKTPKPFVIEPQKPFVNKPTENVIVPQVYNRYTPEKPLILQPKEPVLLPQSPFVPGPIKYVIPLQPEKPFVVSTQKPFIDAPNIPFVTKTPKPFVIEPQKPFINKPIENVIVPQVYNRYSPEKPLILQPKEPVVLPQSPFLPGPIKYVIPLQPEKPFVVSTQNPFVDAPKTPFVPEFSTQRPFQSIFPQPQNPFAINVPKAPLTPTKIPFASINGGYTYPKPLKTFDYQAQRPVPPLTQEPYFPKPLVPESQNPVILLPSQKPFSPEPFKTDSILPTSNRYTPESSKPFIFKPQQPVLPEVPQKHFLPEPIKPIFPPPPQRPFLIEPTLPQKPFITDITTKRPYPSEYPQPQNTFSFVVSKPTLKPLIQEGYVYPKPLKPFNSKPQTEVLQPQGQYFPQTVKPIEIDGKPPIFPFVNEPIKPTPNRFTPDILKPEQPFPLNPFIPQIPNTLDTTTKHPIISVYPQPQNTYTISIPKPSKPTSKPFTFNDNGYQYSKPLISFDPKPQKPLLPEPEVIYVAQTPKPFIPEGKKPFIPQSIIPVLVEPISNRFSPETVKPFQTIQSKPPVFQYKEPQKPPVVAPINPVFPFQPQPFYPEQQKHVFPTIGFVQPPKPIVPEGSQPFFTGFSTTTPKPYSPLTDRFSFNSEFRQPYEAQKPFVPQTPKPVFPTLKPFNAIEPQKPFILNPQRPFIPELEKLRFPTFPEPPTPFIPQSPRPQFPLFSTTSKPFVLETIRPISTYAPPAPIIYESQKHLIPEPFIPQTPKPFPAVIPPKTPLFPVTPRPFAPLPQIPFFNGPLSESEIPVGPISQKPFVVETQKPAKFRPYPSQTVRPIYPQPYTPIQAPEYLPPLDTRFTSIPVFPTRKPNFTPFSKSTPNYFQSVTPSSTPSYSYSTSKPVSSFGPFSPVTRKPFIATEKYPPALIPDSPKEFPVTFKPIYERPVTLSSTYRYPTFSTSKPIHSVSRFSPATGSSEAFSVTYKPIYERTSPTTSKPFIVVPSFGQSTTSRPIINFETSTQRIRTSTNGREYLPPIGSNFIPNADYGFKK